jgi:hypothetical protein
LIEEQCQGKVTNFVELSNRFFASVNRDIKPLDDKWIKQLPVISEQETVPDEYLPTVDDIELLLSKISINTAIGPDTIPNWIWRDCCSILSKPLASVICASMRDAYWPLEWRSAEVIALAKTNQPMSIEKDIRPIGLTCVVSKQVAENIMVKILTNLICKKIDNNQFGGVRGRSTTCALIKLMEELLEGTDNRKICRVLMLDFSKAFERIDHSILMQKLIKMDVPGWLCRWIASFLYKRRQRVKHHGEFSNWVYMDAGVPQGTKFGPIGFIILINDLLADLKFMDDSTMIETLDNIEGSILQERLDTVQNWCDENKMKLNAGKTAELRISFRKRQTNWKPINIDSKEIEPVTKAKLLGFIINDKLDWSDHIASILKKANQRLFFIKSMIKAKFCSQDIISFYQASIRSILEYGAPVWHHSLTVAQSNSLENVQKRVVKHLSGIPKYDHGYDYDKLLILNGLELLSQRRERLCLILFKKIVQEDHPLHNFVEKSSSTHGMNLRHNRTLNLHRCNTERPRKSFISMLTNCL